MIRRKRMPARTSYPAIPGVIIEDVLLWNGKEFYEGQTIRFRGTRGEFKFLRRVTHPGKNVSWIDCMSVKSGAFYSFYEDRLSRVVVKRKPGAKR